MNYHPLSICPHELTPLLEKSIELPFTYQNPPCVSHIVKSDGQPITCASHAVLAFSLPLLPSVSIGKQNLGSPFSLKQKIKRNTKRKKPSRQGTKRSDF
jgi:hypothetical protein